MSDIARFARQHVLVTGASRGIGKVIAEGFAAEGAMVAVNFLSNTALAEEVVRGIRARGGRAVAVRGDVSHPEAAPRFCEEVLAAAGRIDTVVNNAGILRDATFRKMTWEQWREVIDTNLSSMFLVTRAFLPAMVERGFGRVINISSIVGQEGNFGQSNYAAAKAGILGFTRALAREVARKGVTVNAIAPGFIETEMLATMPDEVRRQVLARIPAGRFGKPPDVANAALFLADERASFITGQVLAVNGGQYM
ncbi:MAG: beta-ketoacyl-ACP reductase [Planctomycetes bacterium]|nr:beta-ketoacyl-ACP reductase [Planctomycetota bacterium]